MAISEKNNYKFTKKRRKKTVDITKKIVYIEEKIK